MDLQSVGRIMVIGGVLLGVVGGLLILIGQIPSLGKVPGDIRIEGQGFSCLIPLGTMIILSLVLTVVLNIVIRLINRP